MRIMYITSRVPYPLDKGDKLRAFNQIKELSKNNEVVLCCLNDQKLHHDALSELKKFCFHVEIIPLGRFFILRRLMQALRSSLPFQVHYFLSPYAKNRISKTIDKYLPAHIFCQLIRVSEHVRSFRSVPKTLDYMDALSKGMERRAKVSKGLMSNIFSIESARLKQYETTVFDYFPNKVIISEQDRIEIAHPRNQNIHIVLNGVDTDFFTPVPTEKKFDVLFNGNMSYAPNIEAAKFLVEEVMPLVWKEFPSANVLISGTDPVLAVRNLGSDKVTVSGRVKDIRDSYNKSRIVVAPMLIGTGLQNKLLEAMAMKIPCVTTPLANNALNAVDNESVLIGKNAQELSEKVILLLKNKELSNTIAEKAYIFVKAKYSWENSVRLLEDIMKLNHG